LLLSEIGIFFFVVFIVIKRVAGKGGKSWTELLWLKKEENVWKESLTSSFVS
jgi:hypothetical protein